MLEKVKRLNARYCITLEKGRRCPTSEVIPSSEDLGIGLVYRVTCMHKRYKTYVVLLVEKIELIFIVIQSFHRRIRVFQTSLRARDPTLSPFYAKEAPLASY
jgi:hypothetical protein